MRTLTARQDATALTASRFIATTSAWRRGPSSAAPRDEEENDDEEGEEEDDDDGETKDDDEAKADRTARSFESGGAV